MSLYNSEEKHGSIQLSPNQFLKRALAVKNWIEAVLKEQIGEMPGSLQNGVIVCRVMLAVKEGSIPKIHTNTTLPFKLRENVMFFLQSCEDVGIPRHKIPSIPDLLENKNYYKVIECLEELAFTAERDGLLKVFLQPIVKDVTFAPDQIAMADQLLKAVKIFEAKNAPVRRKSTVTHGTLRTSAPAPAIKAELLHPSRKIRSLPVASHDLRREVLAKEKTWIKLQAIVRGHLARRKFQRRVRNFAYRHNVAKEILSTERVFVRNLRLLVERFLKPMREAVEAGKVPIKHEHIKAIFSDIEVILNYNTQLLQDLEPRVSNWSASQRLGDIFIYITAFLKVYTQYVKDYNHSLETLNNRKKEPKFVSFLRELESHPDVLNVGEISAFLITPIQRIPRYSLLLADLVKHTGDDHRDYKDLCDALKKVQEVATYVNEKKREAENINKILEIQNNFTGKFENLAEPHRRFVKEGLLQVHKEDQPRKFYLFNDLLVGTKAVGGLFQKKELVKVKEFFRLAQVDVNDYDPNAATPQMLAATPSPPITPTESTTPNPSPSATPLSLSIDSPRGEGPPSSPSSATAPAVAFPTNNDKCTFDLVDAFHHLLVRLHAPTVEDKDSWVMEIRKIKMDLETRRKITDESSLKKAQERASMAKAALSQQYATLRGSRYSPSTIKHIVDGDEDQSPHNPEKTAENGGEETVGQTPPSPASPRADGVRDFARQRRQTMSASLPRNADRPNLNSPATSSPVTTLTESTSTPDIGKKEAGRPRRSSLFSTFKDGDPKSGSGSPGSNGSAPAEAPKEDHKQQMAQLKRELTMEKLKREIVSHKDDDVKDKDKDKDDANNKEKDKKKTKTWFGSLTRRKAKESPSSTPPTAEPQLQQQPQPQPQQTE